MKNYSLLAFLLAALCCWSCSNEPAAETGNATTATTEPYAEMDDEILLACEPSDDDSGLNDDAPRHEVYLYMDENKVKIADVMACQAIAIKDYGQYQIPGEAIMAVGGWWAGAGDYYYAIRQGDKLLVKKGTMDESQESNDYGYQTVAEFELEGGPIN